MCSVAFAYRQVLKSRERHMLETTEVRTDSVRENWRAMVEEYQKPETGKSVWQIINSFVPFVVLWYLMYLSLDVSYFLTVLLAIPVAGLTFRIFIIQHDCGHGSFFASRKANDVLGSICGVVTLTPYFYWRKHHAIHHANSGKLDDARGIGEIYTMTVQEYAALPWWKRLGYRIYRNPFFLFVLVPTLLFTAQWRLIQGVTSNGKPTCVGKIGLESCPFFPPKSAGQLQEPAGNASWLC